jgi:hypothetical protein
MAAGTFLLAAATGHVMQNGSTIGAHLLGLEKSKNSGLVQASLTSASTEGTAPAPEANTAAAKQLALAVAQAMPDLPDLPRIEPLPLLTKVRLVSRASAPDALPVRVPTMADREYDALGQVCADPSLVLTYVAPAMIGTIVSAPCHPNETLRISHAGMSFSVRSNDKGYYFTIIPALAAKGEVTVRFEHGKDLHGARVIPDLGSVVRFAVNTRDQAGLHVNAYVDGAVAGDAGHIRPDNPGLPTLALGGYLTRLGAQDADLPMLAEIFTAPANRPRSRIEVVADVTPDNCGRDVLGTTFSLSGSVLPDAGAVSFAMPDCDAVGGILVMDVDRAATVAAFASAQN